MLNHIGKLPLIHISGESYTAGKQHGEQLKSRVENCYKLYKKFFFFNISDDELSQIGQDYLECCSKFNDEYVKEMEGIASGAAMQVWQIVVINARSEIHNYLESKLNTNECTSIYLPEKSILAQNWDWMKECEQLAVIIKRKGPRDFKSLQLCEPGMVGKIGFNDKGLGVCLNYLPGCNNRVGVPITFLLRSVLDSNSMEEALGKIEKAETCSFGNILIGDKFGEHTNIELCGTRKVAISFAEGIPVHTNHYLGKRDTDFTPHNDTQEKLLKTNSLARIERAYEISKNFRDMNINDAKRLLTDRAGGENAICSEFRPLMGSEMGTVCSLIMDLPNLEMHITKGSPLHNEYEVILL